MGQDKSASTLSILFDFQLQQVQLAFLENVGTVLNLLMLTIKEVNISNRQPILTPPDPAMMLGRMF